jgi:hypothetical protein
MFSMGFARLHFLLAVTCRNSKAQILARRDAKMGCKNLYRNCFLDVFGIGRSDGVSSFRGDGDVIRPASGFDLMQGADFFGKQKWTLEADAVRYCHL